MTKKTLPTQISKVHRAPMKREKPIQNMSTIKNNQRIPMREIADVGEDILRNDIVVQGVPFDLNSSFRRGPALAPDHIRKALFSESSNMWTENGIDLGKDPRWRLLPDLAFSVQGEVFVEIENQTGHYLNDGYRVITLGGDHSITYPLISAYAKKFDKLNIFHLFKNSYLNG